MSNYYYQIFTARAPVNIAVIKYWGKDNQKLKTPINDSLSGTLSVSEMCATTSVAMSNTYFDDQLWLNGLKQDIDKDSQALFLLDHLRKISPLDEQTRALKVHIVSRNNFPTAAGLASSAAGYACLAYVLGQLFQITDRTELSKIARLGSGSACRSLFGGFVQWSKGSCHDDSKAIQIVDHNHWPEMRVLICVADDGRKNVSSSKGMALSVDTSELLKYRAQVVVPKRIEAIKTAILRRDFHDFAQITMQDSNQFHAICQDTYPPIFYLNATSHRVITICSIINEHYKINKVAYTFDAGPNGCLYLLEDFLPTMVLLLQRLFPTSNPAGLEIKGIKCETSSSSADFETLQSAIRDKIGSIEIDSLRYVISTSVGSGPSLLQEHLDDQNLRP